MNDFVLGELQRQLANMVRIGKITELDEANARVKVSMAGLSSAWLPWGAARAGTTRSTSMPSVGEQVVVFAPYGDTAQAVVGFSLYQDDHPAASDKKNKHVTVYPDGTRVEYDDESNTYTMTVAGDAKVVVNCKEATVNAENTAQIVTKEAAINASTSVLVDSPQSTFTGAVTVQGLFTYQAGMTGSGGGGATLTGDFKAQGGVFQHNSKNVGSTHTHTGVTPGGGTTGTPP